MQRVRVKICGVRTLEEAQEAIACGADALGFNFWQKSTRYIESQNAREIIQQLPIFTHCVGVFVNESPARIMQIIEQTKINVVQLHGDEEPEFCTQIGSVKIIKAFRVGEDFNIKEMKKYPADAFLLDSKVKGEYGGTGKRFDWRIALEAKSMAPIILAGGINIENVAEAIDYVRPFAIDVCSGVEVEPGKKDLQKLKEFMQEVERANRNLGEED
jgi:phosphoribosylanthranilate isomerase